MKILNLKEIIDFDDEEEDLIDPSAFDDPEYYDSDFDDMDYSLNRNNIKDLIDEIPLPTPGRLYITPRPSPVFVPIGDYLDFVIDELEIEQIVVLSEPVPSTWDLIEEYGNAGIEPVHYPIADYMVPKDLPSFGSFLEHLQDTLQEGKAVAVHCYGGKGRSGLVVACLLVNMGLTGEEAIRHVRDFRPGTIENKDQEDFIIHWFERREILE